MKYSYLVTGGSGSIGSAIVDKLVEENQQVRILTNDENGIFEMKEKYGDSIHYVLGDVRDYSQVEDCMNGIDAVFHCAAVKHVDICEASPWQAVQINVYGTRNVMKAAIRHHVAKVITISTDKAVNPVGVMGATKLLSEKIMTSIPRIYDTVFAVVRFGNVWASRGSLYLRIKEQLRRDQPVTVTDERMQRYIIELDQAARLILEAAESARNGEIWIPKMKPIPLMDIIDRIITEIAPEKQVRNFKTIGIRPGEKLVEELMTKMEGERMITKDEFWVIPPIS